ncbi:hypothetical protein [Enterococcus faecalis]|uniref:hypothetical protein n=1 Tax=Enterococcus faecalis TaxID=1351 RepID=UPI001CEC6B9C|nr:hypothetical protein [Enterococcus faecalis]
MYDGLPGIFIFYVALKYITKNHKYDYVIECIKIQFIQYHLKIYCQLFWKRKFNISFTCRLPLK